MSQDKDGGYCQMCDTVCASPGKCKCENVEIKNEDIFVYNEKGSIHVASWNAAIEAAAEHCDEIMELGIAEDLRGLKK